MAEVEQASFATHRMVLSKDTAILYRHIPAAELDQPGAQSMLGFKERSTYRHNSVPRDKQRRMSKQFVLFVPRIHHFSLITLASLAALLLSTYLPIASLQSSGRLHRAQA